MTLEQMQTFAWSYVLTGRPEVAARDSGLALETDLMITVRRKAAEALHSDVIQGFITEYRGMLRQDPESATRASIDELEEARLLAMALNQPRAAIEAVNAKLKVRGLDVQTVRLDHTSSDGSMTRTAVDPESVADLVRALVG